MAAKASNDPNLLKPFVLTGQAVEEDRNVKDQNDSVKPNENDWLTRALAQDGAATTVEVEFFSVLRSRIKDAK